MAASGECVALNFRKSKETQFWGFRLQGGRDHSAPLSVTKVHEHSEAASAGLRGGDVILKVNNRSVGHFKLMDIQELITSSGNSLEIVVRRRLNLKDVEKTFNERERSAQRFPTKDVTNNEQKTALHKNETPNKNIPQQSQANTNAVNMFPTKGMNNSPKEVNAITKVVNNSPTEVNNPPKEVNAITKGVYNPSKELNNITKSQQKPSKPVFKRLSSKFSNLDLDLEEALSSLTISGTNITLDKETTKTFLLMTIEKEEDHPRKNILQKTEKSPFKSSIYPFMSKNIAQK